MESVPADELDRAACLRILSQNVRDTLGGVADEKGDAAALDVLGKLHAICDDAGAEDLVGRIYPSILKVFQRCTSSGSVPRTSTAKLSLAILQYFLDYGDLVLHDFDPSLRSFFRLNLTRQYADTEVGIATLDFLNENKVKLLASHASLLVQFYPLLFKVAAWGGKVVSKPFLKLLPALIGPSSFLSIFPAILDFPTLVLALEGLEQRSGGLTTASLSAVRTRPETADALLKIMDNAFGGPTFDDRGTDSEEDETSFAMQETRSLFADLLKDENEGLPERHWSNEGMADALAVVRGSKTSDRLQSALDLTPLMLDVYFAISLRDANERMALILYGVLLVWILRDVFRILSVDCLLLTALQCAVLPLVFTRVNAMFPDEVLSREVHRRCMEFILKTFNKSPHFVAILKKPIIDRLGHPHTDADKAELALQLCWAVGEYGGGGDSYKAEARELFESLELLLYENLSSSRVARTATATAVKGTLAGAAVKGALLGTPAQARLLCFLVTAIAKLATRHRELFARARVSVQKIARSQQVLDEIVWRRAQDLLGLMQEPAICASMLGPSEGSNRPGSISWMEGRTKAIAHVPFHILGDSDGPPYHDYSLSDIIGRRM